MSPVTNQSILFLFLAIYVPFIHLKSIEHLLRVAIMTGGGIVMNK